MMAGTCVPHRMVSAAEERQRWTARRLFSVKRSAGSVPTGQPKMIADEAHLSADPLSAVSTSKTIYPCHPERCARERARESKDPEGAGCHHAASGSSTDTPREKEDRADRKDESPMAGPGRELGTGNAVSGTVLSENSLMRHGSQSVTPGSFDFTSLLIVARCRSG